MLNLVMVTYNDWPLIQRAVESVKADRMFFVDGRFRDFPHEPDAPGYSTDGTLEYLKGLGGETSIKIAEGLTEVEKRSLYLLGEPGDWYFHLDADEWVTTPQMPNLNPDLDAALCLIEWENGSGWYPRLFRHIEGMKYEDLHHQLVDSQGNLIVNIYETGEGYRSARIGLKIQHDKALRDPQRIKEKHRYYERLTAAEKRIREERDFGRYLA
jgi:hypothetical protein